MRVDNPNVRPLNPEVRPTPSSNALCCGRRKLVLLFHRERMLLTIHNGLRCGLAQFHLHSELLRSLGAVYPGDRRILFLVFLQNWLSNSLILSLGYSSCHATTARRHCTPALMLRAGSWRQVTPAMSRHSLAGLKRTRTQLNT